MDHTNRCKLSISCYLLLKNIILCMNKLRELSTVALLKDLPEKKLKKGDVGTVVLELSDKMVEVEFVNTDGTTRLISSVPVEQLIRLNFDPIPA